MKALWFLGVALTLAGCGGSGSSGNGTPMVNIDPMIDNRTALAPTITAADFAAFEENPELAISTTFPAPTTPLLNATYRGKFFTQSPIFRDIAFEDPVDRSMEMFGDLELTIGESTGNRSSYEIVGSLTNINLVSDGTPIEQLTGKIPLTGVYNNQLNRDIVANGNADFNGAFGTDDVGDVRIYMSLSGERRLSQPVVEGKVRGFMTGDFHSRFAGFSAFHGLSVDD
jgi:hypothetical protein